MIEDATQLIQLEQKFLVVLDSKIPTALTSSSISTKSDLYFDLQTPIIKSVDDLQLKCSIKNAVFPNSFYTINALNSYYSITLIDSGNNLIGASNISFTIQFGNYSSYQLISSFNSTVGPTFVSLGYNITFTASLITNTNQIQFDLTDPTNTYTNFRISFQPANIGTISSVSQLGDILGFLNDFDYYSCPYVPALDNNSKFSNTLGKITSPYPVNTSGLKCFNIILKNYNTSSIPIQPYNSQVGFKNSIINSNYNSSLVKLEQFRNNIMCNISCNANPMEYIFYDKQSEFYIDIKENLLTRIHIQIVDNLGNLVDFRNQDWTMTLEFSLLKNKEVKTRSFYEILQSGRF